MKKILCSMLIISTLCISVFAADASTDTVASSNTISAPATHTATVAGDFFEILPNMVGASLVIYVSDIDTVIRGRLQNVYTDGIVVRTIFNQTIFISRKSISYFEIKDANAYDF